MRIADIKKRYPHISGGLKLIISPVIIGANFCFQVPGQTSHDDIELNLKFTYS